MLGGIKKAILLELNYIKENKASLLLFFIIPVIAACLFGITTQMQVQWLEGEISYFDFYSPIVLPLILLFVVSQLVVLRIVGERAPYGTLDRDLLAISRTEMFFGKFLANSIIAISQAIIIFVMAAYLFKVRIMGSGLFVLLFLILIALTSLALGLLISVFSKTKEQAIQFIPFIVVLSLIFSGAMIRVEFMPAFARLIASNLPLTLTIEALNKVMVYGHALQQLIPDIAKMSVWIIALLFFGWLRFASEKRASKEKSLSENIFAGFVIAIILTAFFLSMIYFLNPNWERMKINDFKTDRVTDEWGTYPSVAYMNDILPFIRDKINFASSIQDSRRYIWSIQGQYLEAAAVIFKLENASALEKISESGTQLDKFSSDGEEVYYYKRKIKRDNWEQEVTAYIWDENRFIFVVIGTDKLSEKIIKNIISKYPENPTQNKIKPSKEQVDDLVGSLVGGGLERFV